MTPMPSAFAVVYLCHYKIMNRVGDVGLREDSHSAATLKIG